MTSHQADGPRPIDVWQIDALNRYIDGLTEGIDRPAANLDPRLVAAVRTIHGSDAAASDITPGRTEEDRLWRDLMQLRPRPELRALPRIPSGTTLLPLVGDPTQLPVLARHGHPRATGRLRHIGGRTLGLVATLTLVALVALSGLAVWLSAPDRDSSDPGLFGGIAASPTYPAMVSVGATPGVVGDVGPVPADAIRPIVQACTVAPRTMNDAISTLARPYEPAANGENRLAGVPDRIVPDSQANAQGYPQNDASLPGGGPVGLATIADLATLYGEWSGCRAETNNYSLTAAALLTDDGLIRLFFQSGEDLEPDGFAIVRLGSPGPRDFGDRFEWVGQPGRDYLWGFRMLTDGRVAAYLARETSGAPENYDDYPVFAEDQRAYVVFVLTQQGWLIDEFSNLGLG